METGKGNLVAASRKHRQGSRFLGRRLVQSNFGSRRLLRVFSRKRL